MAQIVIVDDSSFQRLYLGRIVRDAGHNVIEASGGNEAIELINKEKPDCMLLDILMPGINGFDVLAYMNKNDISLPVIVISADIQESIQKRCIEKGAFSFLGKFVRKVSLLNEIDRALHAKTENLYANDVISN